MTYQAIQVDLIINLEPEHAEKLYNQRKKQTVNMK